MPWECESRDTDDSPIREGVPENPQKLGKGMDQILPHNLEEEPTLLTFWSETSSFQNHETINFWGLLATQFVTFCYSSHYTVAYIDIVLTDNA